jgi:nucleotide-binding universal stress UspA family protein
MKVLVPLDIVHPVEPIVKQLHHLLPLDSAELLLLYAKDLFPGYVLAAEVSGDISGEWSQHLEDRAESFLKEATKQFSAVCKKVEARIVSGQPALTIEDIARKEKFDITVITTSKHSGLGRFLLGSTASPVVKHAPGTVLILRDGEKSGELKNIVMGIDGSKQSHAAIRIAAKQFHFKPESKIYLVHVVSVAEVLKMISPVEYIAAVENNLVMEGETFLAEGKNILAEHNLKNVECVLREGKPAAEFLKFAESVKADLIVVGAQGRTAVQHFLLGSVSNQIAMEAACAIAVVKSAEK